LCGKVHPNGHTQQEMPAGPKVGEPVPEVPLPDLEGQTVELEAFRGEETLVLFWNPGCGFCQQMLPDLKAWEEDPPGGAPKLLVVSAGTEEANREQGLASTMVLDQQFTAGRVFGAIGTPSAVRPGGSRLGRSKPSRIVASPDGAKSIGGSFGC
jgi:thiol-disulfide isomerase/thioredoxin